MMNVVSVVEQCDLSCSRSVVQQRSRSTSFINKKFFSYKFKQFFVRRSRRPENILADRRGPKQQQTPRPRSQQEQYLQSVSAAVQQSSFFVDPKNYWRLDYHEKSCPPCDTRRRTSHLKIFLNSPQKMIFSTSTVVFGLGVACSYLLFSKSPLPKYCFTASLILLLLENSYY